MYEMLIIVAKTATLILGGSITYYALRAYGRTGDPSLRALAIGFGVVTAGAILGGLADLLIENGLELGVTINSALTAVGFAVIFYSLFMD